jgi:hypothetical protein
MSHTIFYVSPIQSTKEFKVFSFNSFHAYFPMCFVLPNLKYVKYSSCAGLGSSDEKWSSRSIIPFFHDMFLFTISVATSINMFLIGVISSWIGFVRVLSQGKNHFLIII